MRCMINDVNGTFSISSTSTTLVHKILHANKQKRFFVDSAGEERILPVCGWFSQTREVIINLERLKKGKETAAKKEEKCKVK